VVGSLGGSTFATVAPPLIDEGSEAARVTFAATTPFVTVTIWSTLESIFLGVWLLGINRLLRPQVVGLGTLGIVAGIGALLSAVRSGLTGQSVADLAGPVDLVVVGLLGLYVPWFAWLGVELFRARSSVPLQMAARWPTPPSPASMSWTCSQVRGPWTSGSTAAT
jgi:hypothetical protein